jgi:hypothetical protein
MKLEIADIATNEKHKLNGFKVLGIFPFYLRYIRTDTHIQLSKIKEQIQEITKEPVVNDFYDPAIQVKALPLINKYCVTALVNKRMFGWFFKLFLNRKIKGCSHKHIENLYVTILRLDNPGFFLGYWKSLHQKDSTLLSEEKQS